MFCPCLFCDGDRNAPDHGLHCDGRQGALEAAALEVPPPTCTRFDGDTFEPEVDETRLGAQSRRVFVAIRDGHWRTLAEIAHATGDPEASISARLRDFRKRKFGAHEVERRRRGDPELGLFEYRLIAVRVSVAS
jgi:hypothetical protein